MNELVYHGNNIYSGSSLLDERVDYTSWEARNILCKMILQAFRHSMGLEMSDYADDRKSKLYKLEKSDSTAYLLSVGFREDCDWLGLPDEFCKRVRKIILGQETYQWPLFRDFDEMPPEKLDQSAEYEEISVGLLGA